MTTSAILTDLFQRGVRVWAEAGRLELDDVSGVLTDDDVATLAAHKAELLTALTSQPGTCPNCHEPANLQHRADDVWYCPGCRLWMHGDGSPLPKIERPRPITLEQQEAERLAADLLAAGCSFIPDEFDGDWNVRLPVKISAALLTRFECADRNELQRAIGKLAELENTQSNWVN